MRLRTALAVLGLAIIGVVAVVGYAGWHSFEDILGPEEGCTATVDGHSARLSLEQAQNAALITAVAVQRGMPAHAATIALAAAYQESKLYNLESGDRDSVGLFQQRPSQGWGTRAELMNPYYAANAFYDALDRVDGYQSMRVTEAAQRVQRSGFPEAYAAHEADARVLASSLTGWSPHAFSCVVTDAPPHASARLTASGLTHRADVVRREVTKVFGSPPLGGFAPGGVSTGHMTGSAHYEGRAVDIFVRPVSAANKVRGWAIAQYLVAMADRLDVETVIFDGRIWTADRSSEGWRTYHPPERSGDPAILMHRDHVHVDVFP